MKKQIRAASAVFLAAFSAATVLTACGEKAPSANKSTAFTTAISVETTVTITENSDIETTVSGISKTTESDVTAAKASVAATVKETVKPTAATTAAATKKTTTTKKPPSTEVIPEKSKGISLMTKTTPVNIGNSAVIMIQGTAGKKYTIDFYESTDKTANYKGLETKTADSNGFVTWSFIIEDDCDPGDRKIIIKEKNSSNYIQTSITVQ